MTWLVLGLIVLATVISAPMCAALIAMGHRMGTFDSPGVAGQVKDRARRIPNTGGVAIFWSIVLPLLVFIGAAHWMPGLFPESARAQLSYIELKTPMALMLIGCLALLHVMGLIDDRRPLGPLIKLVLMALPALAAPLLMQTRLLTALDPLVGGPWLSVVLTACWFLAITNAMNFLDNMDGLSAGIAAIASACLLAVTAEKQQWLLASCLALIIGACAGFLFFNAPRPGGARLFMGDGGSLVIGYLMAFVAVRVTYYDPASAQSSRAHAVFMPVVILAVPLYDLIVITTVRLWQGKSPMVGDTNHASHRLVKRGLTRAGAVYVLWGFTLATGLCGLALAKTDGFVAALIGASVVAMLAVLAGLEYVSRGSMRATMPAPSERAA
ncbi:MAG: MraY family glycosyltransferase [Phycisphaerales bacterium]